MDSKELKPVDLKGNQPWIFIGRTDAEAEAPMLWPPDVKSWLIGKDPDSRKDSRQEEKGMTEDEMVGWYHRLNGHEFEQTLWVGEGQGSLVCCSPWGCKELEMTEVLNNDSKIFDLQCCVSFSIAIHGRVIQLCIFQIIFHYRLLQDIECRSVCRTEGPCWLSILFTFLGQLSGMQDLSSPARDEIHTHYVGSMKS